MQKLLLGTFTSKWMYWDVEPYSILGLVSRMLKIVAAVTSFRLILLWDDRSVSNENCLRLTPKPKWSVAIFSFNVNSQNAVEAQSIQFVVMKQAQECSAKTKTESKTKAWAGQEQDPNQKIINKTKPRVFQFTVTLGSVWLWSILTAFPLRGLTEPLSTFSFLPF